MKRVPLEKCEIEVIECDCGYHLGVDATFLEQVEDFETICPSCKRIINTCVLESQAIDFITGEDNDDETI